MSVEFTADFMTLHDKLNPQEAIIFCLFLQSEYYRHLDDAHVILMRIAQMEKKHGFNTKEEMEKLEFLKTECKNYHILHDSL